MSELFSDYELFFMKLNEIEKNVYNTNTNIIIIDDTKNMNSINFKKLPDNYLILSNLQNKILNLSHNIIKTPTPINNIKTTIENFVQNLKIKFHDITIENEKLTNIKNNSFCYLTKLESEILSHLIIEKESTKKYIQENILNIKAQFKQTHLIAISQE